MNQVAAEQARDAKSAFARAKQEVEQRRTEIRRRLSTVRGELHENLTSFHNAEGPLGEGRIANPQLLAGAWTASAPALAVLVADVKLIADIARTYDRVEELRWRLRTRTEQGTANLDEMTRPLVAELIVDTEALLERIDAELAEPSVQELGVLHRVSGSMT